jgi:hypothetical protein
MNLRRFLRFINRSTEKKGSELSGRKGITQVGSEEGGSTFTIVLL